MTSSLPVQGQRVPSRKEAVLNTLSSVTVRALPRIPNAVKRAMLGGRSVTIDGNTLDTTLQLMLAGMTATGRNSLVSEHRRRRRAAKDAHRRPQA